MNEYICFPETDRPLQPEQPSMRRGGPGDSRNISEHKQEPPLWRSSLYFLKRQKKKKKKEGEAQWSMNWALLLAPISRGCEMRGK